MEVGNVDPLRATPPGGFERALSKLKARVAPSLLDASWTLGARSAKVSTQSNSPRVVISLTSYPKRFKFVGRTVKSLLLQTVCEKRVILWVANEDRKHIPSDVLGLCEYGLEIMSHDDHKVHLKYLGSFVNFPNNKILLCDDDIYYWPHWAEELLLESDRHPTAICCHRAHGVGLAMDGVPLPYDQWLYELDGPAQGPLVFGTGVLGTLYPPGVLHPLVTDISLARELCPSADDIWLYWMARLVGTEYRQIGPRRPVTTWPASQAHALWQINQGAGAGNDRQMSAMIAKFGGGIFK